MTQLAYKRMYTHTCKDCNRPATYQVRDRYHRDDGVYCEEHADKRIETLNGYQKIVERASRE
jgi:hypothetical protein